MTDNKYFFQQKERSFTKKLFKKGLTTTSYILFALKEAGEGCLEEMPDYYFGAVKKMFGVGRYKRPQFKKETLMVSLHRLKKQGLITKNPKKKVYCLTEQGEKLMVYIEDRYSVLKKPWDGKFRIVMFDIPNQKKRWREWLRQELFVFQFQLLQRSVYIGKCPLPESFYKEINEAGLSKCVFVLTIGEIDRKKQILEMFKAD